MAKIMKEFNKDGEFLGIRVKLSDAELQHIMNMGIDERENLVFVYQENDEYYVIGLDTELKLRVEAKEVK